MHLMLFYASALAAGFSGCLTVLAAVSNFFFYRVKRSRGTSAIDTSLIKPLKGADPGLAENLQACVDFAPKTRYQIVIAIESQSDPAYAIAREFQAKNRVSDIFIVLTGPSKGRMGKMHNLIEAYPRTDYEIICSSDGDVKIDPEVFPWVYDRLARAHAMFFPPCYEQARDLLSTLTVHPLNYFFTSWCAPLAAFDHLDFCAGGFMAFRRKALMDIGGFEPYAHSIADDVALGRKMHESGMRIALAHHAVIMPVTRKPLDEALRQIRRVNVMMRKVIGWQYFVIPLFLPTFVGAVFLLVAYTQGKATLGWLVFCALCVARIASAAAFDWGVFRRLAPLWNYPVLLIGELGAMFFWPIPFFTDVLQWRGVRYRVAPGGEAQVIDKKVE